MEAGVDEISLEYRCLCAFCTNEADKHWPPYVDESGMDLSYSLLQWDKSLAPKGS